MALAHLKVVEFAGLAPGPFAGLVLADHGASVTRIDRPSRFSSPSLPNNDVLARGKRSLAIDAKAPAGRALLARLIADADVVIDPFRPGVLEKLDLGPEMFLDETKGLNKRLIYARMAGFPTTGPHKDMAGHDINYIALSGVLSILPGHPTPSFPLNLLADFAGGGMMCALGILLALVERGVSGRGQIVSADMVSGTRYLSSFPLLHTFLPPLPSHSFTPFFPAPRGQNILDGGAPFYSLYACADSEPRWIAVGCLEPAFFKVFIERFVGVVGPDATGWMPDAEIQTDKSHWQKLRKYLEAGFKMKTRDEWAAIFLGTDACVTPVLIPAEAATSLVPAPHPDLSRTPPYAASVKAQLLRNGEHTDEVLTELGVTEEERGRLERAGIVSVGEQREKGLMGKL